MVGYIGGALALLLGVECIRELNMFRVTHYRIDSPKLKTLGEEKKIVFLSDLHNKVYGNNNEELIRTIAAQQPDLILIAGDMLIGKEGADIDPAVDFVKRLPRICPVYYGNGNHEQRMKEQPEKYGDVYERFRGKLVDAGVKFLENETVSLDWIGVEAVVSGAEYSMRYFEKFKRYEMPVEEIESRIGKADPHKYQILIAHNPVYFQTYKRWGADLVVSGHLHGGIVRIPGIGGVITPQAWLFPRYSGELTVDGDSSLVVSKGLGTHTVNMRLFNKAEVIVLHFGHSCVTA
ncbi:metallophosphoesterase [Hespellia stercorisuis]|uniref:Calcineurin-like phosphoesterase domain-containing protein n=1 Tax=Hespellia stercorisuis DSM 15480 TaxID=1121950 RepID=A0A1M6HJY1_9FIRM|nr:metallophosphoesterase [Hespellia stercorisuis]SHJ22462.1 hypothetical protein SAMN02745243_00044 [Hespellia stercorisuis DSM 15480]